MTFKTLNRGSIFLLVTVAALFAQQFQWLTDFNGESGGHTTCGFLNLPHSATFLGRGLASSPGERDATDLPVLTANTALADRYRFAITHLEWLLGLRNEFLGALFPVLDVGTFGGYAHLFTPGKFENARDIDEQPSDLSYVEYSIGATYARSFLNKQLAAGCAVAFVESHIEEQIGRTVTGSIDLRYAPLSFIAAHLYATSIGKPIAYSDRSAESLPTQLGLSLQVLPLPEDLSIKNKLDFDIGIGARKVADEPLTAGISTQIHTGKYFNVRVGYEYAQGSSPSINGLSAGAGLKIDAIKIDGAWRYLSNEFGPVWAASIQYEREELVKRTAEDYYKIAEKHYRKGRYFLCTFNARRALRLDPNMWKAHALISRVKSDILRSKRREIVLIYTGNARGNFTIPIEEGMPGGFARQATVIAALRQQFPLSFAIEAGNMVTPTLQPLRSSFVGSYLEYIQYDAMGCGSGELLYGMPKVIKSTSGHQNLICANSLSTPKGVVRHRIIEREGYRFFVTSYINPWIVPENSRGLLIPIVGSELAHNAKNCDLRILIAHDNWQEIRQRAHELTDFDIVICGNLEQRFASPMKIGNLTVLSAGSKGQFVGSLTLRFDENRNIIGMENKLIPCDSRITSDSTIARKIALFTKNATIEKTTTGVSQPTEGTFVFTSDRDGKNDVFLKISDQMAEFPMTRSIADTCDNPVLSFKAGLIACRAADDTCRRLLVMRLDGSDMRYTADNLQVRDATFTPDGTWLYYAAASCGDTLTDIYRVKTDGGPSYPIVSFPQAVETAPVFTADGTAMIFCSDQDGTMQLYLTNPEGKLPLRITDESANHTSPAFSPDGAFIAYLSDYSNFGGRRDLWLFERDGGKHRRITQRSNVKEFCWLSDARTIVYTMGAVTDELATVDVTNYRFNKIIKSDTTKQWHERAPQIMQFEGNEHIIYVRYFPETGDRQIFRVKPDGTGNTRIVNSPGRDWFPMSVD